MNLKELTAYIDEKDILEEVTCKLEQVLLTTSTDKIVKVLLSSSKLRKEIEKQIKDSK